MSYFCDTHKKPSSQNAVAQDIPRKAHDGPRAQVEPPAAALDPPAHGQPHPLQRQAHPLEAHKAEQVLSTRFLPSVLTTPRRHCPSFLHESKSRMCRRRICDPKRSAHTFTASNCFGRVAMPALTIHTTLLSRLFTPDFQEYFASFLVLILPFWLYSRKAEHQHLVGHGTKRCCCVHSKQKNSA